MIDEVLNEGKGGAMIYELSFDGYRLGLFPTEAGSRPTGRPTCRAGAIRSANGPKTANF